MIDTQFDEIQNDVSFNSDLSGTYVYTSIKNSGIYVDQLNQLINYVGQYIKQYLTYKMIDFANKCIVKGSDNCNEQDLDYKKAIEINNILKQFDGNNL